MSSRIIEDEITLQARSAGKADVRHLIFLLFLAALVFLPFLGAAGLFDPTDSFFIESGREMLETHKFIVPLMNYEQWLDKPALDFCLIAASLSAFGVNELAGRLPAALSGVIECLVLFGLSRQILTVRQSLLSALVLISTPLFVVVGRTSLSDEPLSLFLCTALLSFAVASIKNSIVFLIPAYAALALAILLKGPPLALAFTGLVLVGYLLSTYRSKFFWHGLKLHPLAGLAAAAVIALPYYIWAHVGTGGEFTTNFFLRQNLGRAAGTVNHVRPFWWYIPVVLAGVFPWSVALLFAARYLKKIFLAPAESSTTRQKLIKFACCWGVLGFVFFSAVPTKLETYIVPIMPAIAIIVGCFLDVIIRAHSGKLGARLLAFLLSLTGVVVLATPIAIKGFLDKPGQYLIVESVAALVLLVICLAGVWRLKRRDLQGAVYALLAVMISYCAIFIPLLFVVYHKSYQEPIDQLIAYAYDENADLAVLYFSMPSAMFKYRHAIPVIKDEKEMLGFAEGSAGKRWVLINRDVLSLLKWTERSPRVVAHEGRWWLFAVGRNCRQEGTVEWNGVNVGVYPTLADKHRAVTQPATQPATQPVAPKAD